MASIQDMGALLRSQLQVQEDPPDSNRVLYSLWYGAIGPWCQMFQNWAHVKLGMVPPGFDPAVAPKGSAFTPTCADWFRRRGRWSTTPHVGDLVYFDFPGDGVDRISHVGWVEALNADGSIDTIEGNTDERGGRTGGKVMRKIRSSGIVGYGRPDYEEDSLAQFTEEQLRGIVAGEVTDVLRMATRGDVKLAAGGYFHPLAANVAAIKAAVGQLTDDEANVLAAIAGIQAGGPIPPEQLAELKAALVAALPGYTVSITPQEVPV